MNRTNSTVRLGASLTGVGIGLGLAAYAIGIEPYWPEIVYRRMPIRRLPLDLAGRTLVHISDLHVGRTDPVFIAGCFRRIAALEPDIVVLTGDLVDKRGASVDGIGLVYERMPLGRLATVATLGNHDYGRHWEDDAAAQRTADTVASLGITVLRNGVCDVGGLQLAGLDELWALQCLPTLALRQLDPGRAAIALTHNPDSVDLAEWGGFEGWILAGHTHGGQIRAPLLPPPFVPVRNKRYVAGEYALGGKRRLYINRGLGQTFAIRFSARPEITVFVLEGL